jgi:hypothetical protein
VKITEKEIRDMVREELENIPEQEKPTGPGAMQIKKANQALARVKNVMGQALSSLEGLGARARVNFALNLLAPLNLEAREIVLLKQELDKKAKEK